MADNLIEGRSSVTFKGNGCNGEYLYTIQTDKSIDAEIHGRVTIFNTRFPNKEIWIDLQNCRAFVKEVESVLKYLEDHNIISKE